MVAMTRSSTSSKKSDDVKELFGKYPMGDIQRIKDELRRECRKHEKGQPSSERTSRLGTLSSNPKHSAL
jgi:hypothetical protein